jgi:hypothetical protein
MAGKLRKRIDVDNLRPSVSGMLRDIWDLPNYMPSPEDWADVDWSRTHFTSFPSQSLFCNPRMLVFGQYPNTSF